MAKIWERHYSLHRMQRVMAALLTPLARQVLGLSLNRIASLAQPNGNYAFYADSGQWQSFLDVCREIVLSPTKFRLFHRRYAKLRSDLIRACQSAARGAQPAIAGPELARRFQRFLTADDRFMLIGQWLPFYLADCAEQAVAERAQFFEPAGNRRAGIIGIIFTPTRLSMIRRERENLLQIALAQSATKRQALLKKHVRRFQWIPAINYFESPWSQDFFKQQIGRIRRRNTARHEIIQMQKDAARRRAAFWRVLNRAPAEDRPLIRRAHQLAFLKDDRDDARRQAYFSVKPLYSAIARHLRLPHQEDVLLLTSNEILGALLKERSIKPGMLAKRRRGAAILFDNGQYFIETGKQLARRQRAHLQRLDNDEYLRGTTAWPGNVRGTARIVDSAQALPRIRRGDILIAVTTHPDYVPAMRLCSAIVTDEGGLTCHAAIVSRELGIPCVVGTKVATKVFKDGDWVEVDAERGIVKKIATLGRAEYRRTTPNPSSTRRGDLGGAKKGIVRLLT